MTDYVLDYIGTSTGQLKAELLELRNHTNILRLDGLFIKDLDGSWSDALFSVFFQKSLNRGLIKYDQRIC